MRKREQNLWDTLKRQANSGLNLQRIENLVGDGIPDVYVGFSGKWVELKVPPRIPARPQTQLLGAAGLRPSQINWHIAHASGKAPPAYILIRLPGTRELLLVPGRMAPGINAMPLDSLRVASVANTWPEILKVLA